MVMFAIISKEATKDMEIFSTVEMVFKTLEKAIDYVNMRIKEYIDMYELLDDFDGKYPSIDSKNVNEKKINHNQHLVMNVKQPHPDNDDEDEFGVCGNIQFFVQSVPEPV